MAADKETSWLIKLIDKVTAPLKKIQGAVRGPLSAMDKLQARTEKVQGAFSGLGRMIAGIGLGVSLMALTQESMAFEKGMAQVNTVMKASPAELAKVSDEVRDLSKVMAIPRSQLTEGLNSVVQAGVPASDAMQFLTDSTKAAIGGQADLTTVIETTAGVLGTYGMGFNEAASLQNKMQKAVDIGMMSMQEFASALPNVTTLASSLGVSIDEVTGAFAGMTGKTGNAAAVSTQLASVMSGLINPTQQAEKAAQQLGIQFDAMSVKRAGGLSNFLNDLMPKIDALSKRTGQTKEGIIAQLFGRKEAIIAVLAMTGNLKNGVLDATEAMRNSAGAVDYAFGQMNETADAKMTKMKNTIMAAWDKIYEKIVPILASIVDGVASTINWITNFAQTHPYITTTIGVIAGLEIAVAALSVATGGASKAWQWFMTSINGSFIKQALGLIVTLGASVLGLQAPFWAATSSTWALNAALMANPITWIVLAIVAVIAAVVLMIKYWDDVKAWFVGFGKWIYDHSPFGWVMELVKQWLPALKKAWNSLWDSMKSAVQPVLDILDKPRQIIMSLLNFLKGLGKKVLGWLGLPTNLDFRGYGETPGAASSENVFTDDMANAYINDSVAGLQTQNNNTNSGKINLAGGSNSAAGMDASGGTKGAAIINFKNTFDIKINGASGDLRKVAEEVVTYITDMMSDAVIVTANS